MDQLVQPLEPLEPLGLVEPLLLVVVLILQLYEHLQSLCVSHSQQVLS